GRGCCPGSRPGGGPFRRGLILLRFYHESAAAKSGVPRGRPLEVRITREDRAGKERAGGGAEIPIRSPMTIDGTLTDGLFDRGEDADVSCEQTDPPAFHHQCQ